MPYSTSECPLIVRSNHYHFGGPWRPWAAATIHGAWRPRERIQRRSRGTHGRKGLSGGPEEGHQHSQPRSGPITGLPGPLNIFLHMTLSCSGHQQATLGWTF